MRTLLISLGGGDYPSAPQLKHAAFGPSSTAVAGLLGESGLKLIEPGDHLQLFDAPQSWPDQLMQIRNWLREEATAAAKPDNLLIHYVGHGSFKPNSSDYFLTINRTDEDDPWETSISVAGLHRILSRNAGRMRVFLLLDACFAAAALRDLQSGTAGDLVGARLAEIGKEEEGLSEHGLAALCSADKFEGASARGREGLTQFTDGLLTVLRTGDASEGKALSFAGLAKLLRRTLREKYGDEAIMPILHAPENSKGRVSEFPIFPNRAESNVRALGDLPEDDRRQLQNKVMSFVEEFSAAAADATEFEKKCEQLRGMGRREVSEARTSRANFHAGYDVTQRVDDAILFLDQVNPAQAKYLSPKWWIRKFAPARAYQTLVAQFGPEPLERFTAHLQHIKDEALMDNAALEVHRQNLSRIRNKLVQMGYIATEMKLALRDRERALPARTPTGENLWLRPQRLVEDAAQEILTALTDIDRSSEELILAKDEAYSRIRIFDQAMQQIVALLRRVGSPVTPDYPRSRERSSRLLQEAETDLLEVRTLVEQARPLARGAYAGAGGYRKIPVPSNLPT